MQKFSYRLISLRKENKLTQEDMAKVINKKRSTVSGYETEGKEPDLETICLIAEYFGVTTDYLLGYSDERTHTEKVFFNDTVNFEQNFKNMPEDLRPVVSKCFDSFYLLLNRDTQLARSERLNIYQELLFTLQSLRADIRGRIENSDGSLSDPVALSDLMALQSQLKNEISSLLDRLMQADMEIAFNVKSDTNGELSSKSAI
ncbi:MAG: helix-turn-helix domain-containing protein [Ruminococcus sp.]|nr:helix-turn-helix domain-containing protein [Ruminococcus sp.]